jgi:hypothetical protein
MLGDLIYEAEGKLMNMRVISVEEERPKIEVTISQNGLLRGIQVTSIVTYSSIPREQGGAIYAEGKGVFMTKKVMVVVKQQHGQDKELHIILVKQEEMSVRYFVVLLVMANLHFLII